MSIKAWLKNKLILSFLPQKGKAIQIKSVESYEYENDSILVATHLSKKNRYYLNELNIEILLEAAAQASILNCILKGIESAYKEFSFEPVPKIFLVAKNKITKCTKYILEEDDYLVKSSLDVKKDNSNVFKFACFKKDDTLCKDSFFEGLIFTRTF